MNLQNHSRRYTRPIALLAIIATLVILVGCNMVNSPTEQYTSIDGNLSVSLPYEWDVIDEDAIDGRTMLYVANNDGIIDETNVMTTTGLIIIALPDFIVSPEGDLVRMTADELISLVYYDLSTVENTEVGPIETFNLDNGREGVSFSIADETSVGMYYTFELEDGILATGIAATGPESEISPETEHILNSVEFVGDAESFRENVKATWGLD